MRKKIKNSYCPEFWNHIATKVTGNYSFCCIANDLPYSIKDFSPLEHYNSEYMKKAREAALSGDRSFLAPYCSKCYDLEKSTGMSRRIDQIKTYGFFDTLDVKRPPYLHKLDLKIFGNKCNLRCIICNEKSSSSIEKEKKQHGEKCQNIVDYWPQIEHQSFFNDLKTLLPITNVIRFTGGEPFLNTRHWEILDFIIENGLQDRIELEYISNLTVLPGKMIDYIKIFKNIKIHVSIDAIGECNNYIRYGSDFQVIVDNLKLLSQIPGIKVSVTSTVTNLSVISIYDTYEYFKSQNIRVGFNMLNTPKELRCWNLPEPIKKQVVKKIKYHPRYKTIVKALKNKFNPELFSAFKDYINKLDGYRNTDILAVYPQLKAYW